MRYILILVLFLAEKSSAIAQIPVMKVGTHAFTIQYLTFDKNTTPGTVMIRSIGKDEYSIEGEQKDKENNYVTIKGIF